MDWEDGQTVVSDYPLIIKATARTGYHFLYWVDHNNNIVSYESSFVAPQSAAGVWENSEYYAIFAEDEDVKIYYRISDYDKGWLRWSSEELAPATGNPRGTELILLPGFELDHWEDDLGNIVGGPDDKIFFPPRYDTYNNSGYKGQDTYVSHVYTAVVKSAPAVKFKVEHYRQEESGTTFEFVEEATGYYAGPTNGFVAVVKHDDSGRYHLAQLSDTARSSRARCSRCSMPTATSSRRPLTLACRTASSCSWTTSSCTRAPSTGSTTRRFRPRRAASS